MDWEHVLASLPAACSIMNGTKGGFLVAALPAGWSRMARVAISLISVEKNQTVTLCPKSQASAVQLVRGTLALGHGSRGTAASCSSSLPAGKRGRAEHLSSRGEQHQQPACFKENPPHLPTLHFSSSGSDVCQGSALPVRALLLAGILQLISSPLVSKPNFVPLPTCMAELITGTHYGTWH